MIKICFIILFLLNASAFAQGYLKYKNFISPLKSNRSDIEKKFNSIVNNSDGWYENNEVKIFVNYSKKQCDNGWSVQMDTVIDYKLYPKKDIKFDDYKINSDQFVKTWDDAGTFVYTNIKEGIQIFVENGFVKDDSDKEALVNADIIQSIRHTPSEKDKNLRCEGFPEYSPVSETYYPHYSYKLNGTKDDLERIANYLAEIKVSSQMKAYIFVYEGKKQSNVLLDEFTKDLKKFAFEIMEIDDKKLQINIGGCRENTEVELFLIPESFPPAVSMPEISCSMNSLCK